MSEDTDIATWYATLDTTPDDEVRRLVCLHIALCANATPKSLIPLARGIELFLLGHSEGIEDFIPNEKVN